MNLSTRRRLEMYIPAKIGPVVLDGGASGTGENSAGRMVARPKTAARRGATVRSSNLGRQYFVYIYMRRRIKSGRMRQRDRQSTTEGY